MGTLFIVSTPIGNLEDFTFRGLRILREASVIAAEDTRRTKKLCAHYGIDTPLTSYHDFNKEEKTPILLARLQKGADIVLVSDAGTPLISDPGYYLVKRATDSNIPVVPIPGPSAILAALAVSGLPTDAFIFEGFLPRKPGAKKKFLSRISDDHRTLIVFETAPRLSATLEAIFEAMGHRKLVIARELTKLHEEIIRGDIAEVRESCISKPLKGEITIVIEGKVKPKMITSHRESV